MDSLETLRSRTVQWPDPVETAQASASMSGWEWTHAIKEGRIPEAPLLTLLNIRWGAIERGSVELLCEPDEYHYNALGVVHGGFFATILDTVMGYTLMTLRPAGGAFTTAEMSFKLLKGLSRDSGTVKAVGKVSHLGRRIGFVEAELFDREERLCATASCTCVLIRR